MGENRKGHLVDDEALENDRLPDEPAPESEADQEKKVDEDQKSEKTDEEGPNKDEDAADPDEDDGGEDKDEQDEQNEPTPSQQRRARQKARRIAEKAELEELRGRVRSLEQENVVQSETEKAPKEDEYEDYQEFIKAQASFVARQTAREETAKIQQVARDADQQEENKRSKEKFDERQALARERYSDYDEAVFDDNLPVTQEMAEVIMDSEKGPDIAYYLGTHPDEAARIAGLSPVRAAMELGRIEAKITLPAPRTETKARKPMKTLAGGDRPTKSPEDMTPEEYRNWRSPK